MCNIIFYQITHASVLMGHRIQLPVLFPFLNSQSADTPTTSAVGLWRESERLRHLRNCKIIVCEPSLTMEKVFFVIFQKT